MGTENAASGSSGGPAAFTPTKQFIRYNRCKRAMDFFFSLLLMVPGAVPSCVIGILVTISSRGPAIFSQERIGRNGKPFKCYKFRTMRNNAPHNCATPDLEDADKYITPLGKVLRKTSLDELPQLFNVVKGDMSFIGPRPLIPEESDIHEERMKRGVYLLRPGISGLAQINGRDRLDADTKVKYDEEYLHNISFRLDAKIVFGTFFGVLKGSDIVDGKEPE